MPKFLFYAGVICSAAAGLALILLGLSAPADSSGSAAAIAQIARLTNPSLEAFLYVSIFAIAALLLRMAALVAPRDLFAALLAGGGLACTVATTLIGVLTSFRVGRAGAELSAAGLSAVNSESLLQIVAVAVCHAGGVFAGLTLLALRPYFDVHASRLLAILVCIPAPLAISVAAGILPAAASGPLLLFLMGILLTVIAAHSLRHRRLFLEPTNLRELLDSRQDPAGASFPSGLPVSGRIAFDS